eukprot:SAG11_NODE_193_length_12862_cov_7.128888_17_plen_354_part_00
MRSLCCRRRRRRRRLPLAAACRLLLAACCRLLLAAACCLLPLAACCLLLAAACCLLPLPLLLAACCLLPLAAACCCLLLLLLIAACCLLLAAACCCLLLAAAAAAAAAAAGAAAAAATAAAAGAGAADGGGAQPSASERRPHSNGQAVGDAKPIGLAALSSLCRAGAVRPDAPPFRPADGNGGGRGLSRHSSHSPSGDGAAVDGVINRMTRSASPCAGGRGGLLPGAAPVPHPAQQGVRGRAEPPPPPSLPPSLPPPRPVAGERRRRRRDDGEKNDEQDRGRNGIGTGNGNTTDATQCTTMGRYCVGINLPYVDVLDDKWLCDANRLCYKSLSYTAPQATLTCVSLRTNNGVK